MADHTKGARAKQNKSKKSSPKGNKTFGAQGAFPGVSMHEVNSLANATVRPEIRAAKRERQSLKRQFGNDTEAANTLFNRGLGDLDHVYGEVGSFVGSQNQKINNTFNAAGTASQAATQALLSQLTNSGSAVGAGVNAELSQLGIADGSNMNRFMADQQNATQRANQAGADNQANLQAMQAGANSVGDLLLGANRGSYQSQAGQLLNAKNDAMVEAQQNKNDAMAEVNGAIRDIRAGRKDLIPQLMQQLLQTKWGQYIDQQGLNLQKAQFGLQKQAQGFSQARATASDAASASSSAATGSSYSAMANALGSAIASTFPGKGGKKKGSGTPSPSVNSVLP